MATVSERAAPFRAPPATDRLLDGLTAEQVQAVTHGPGVLQTIAEAGAGPNGWLVIVGSATWGDLPSTVLTRGNRTEPFEDKECL